MASPIPRPEGRLREAARWEQTPLVVRPLGVHLLAVIPQQAAPLKSREVRLAEREARWPPRSPHAARPPSSEPPSATPSARSAPPKRPGATPGPRPGLVAPPERRERKPARGACGPRACSLPMPSSTPQQIALPPIPRGVTPSVLHKTPCPRCGRGLHAQLPAQDRDGDGPRVTALIGARTLARERGALWTWVVEPRVAPTHHRAARALRCAVRWRKRRQGPDQAMGDRWVERMLSLREPGCL